MTGTIARHPISSYIILLMIWSWGFWSLLFTVIKPGELLHHPPPLSYLYVVLGGMGPSLIGIILTKLVDGKEGITRLKNRLTHWRVGWWWLTLCIIPILTGLPLSIRSIFGYPVNYLTLKSLILPGLLLGISAGCMEEFGWRGFLLPRLLKRFSPIQATLILGLIWGGLWHGYADYFGLGNKWLIIILLGPILLSAWSFILTWVYVRTKGSLLLSIFVHASISSSAFIFGQTYKSSSEELVWTTISIAVALIASVIVGVFGISLPKIKTT